MFSDLLCTLIRPCPWWVMSLWVMQRCDGSDGSDGWVMGHDRRPTVSSGRDGSSPHSTTPTSTRSSPTRPTRASSRSSSCGKLNGDHREDVGVDVVECGLYLRMGEESVGTGTAGAERRVGVAVVEPVARRVAVADVGPVNQLARTRDRSVAVGRRAAPSAFRTQAAPPPHLTRIPSRN